MNMSVKPKIGDKIIVLNSDYGSIVGEEGTIADIVEVLSQTLYRVNWESSELRESNPSIIEGVDYIRVLKNPKKVNEDTEDYFKSERGEDLAMDLAVLSRYYGRLNPYFDFYEQLRKSSVVNMFTNGIPDLIWMGRDQVDDAFPKSQTRDNEEFQVLLDMADTMRMKMINGTVKFVTGQIIPKNPDADELELVNKYIRKNSKTLYQYFMHKPR